MIVYGTTAFGFDDQGEISDKIHYCVIRDLVFPAGSCREFAAVMDDREVCWGQVHFLPQRDIAYLRWIYVDGQVQHQGVGTKVMLSLFSDLFKMGIRRFDTDTARSNTAAQAYYEKCRFTNEGITRSYFTK